MNLYISRQGQTLGPFSDEQVRQQVNSGALSLDDMACPVGAQQWLPIRQVLPPAPNQPAAPPPPANYPPAGYPSSAYAPSQPPRRSGRGLLYSAVALLVILLAAAGIYVAVPSEVVGKTAQYNVHGDDTLLYPSGATVYLYMDPSQEQTIRGVLSTAQVLAIANPGKMDDTTLNTIAAGLPPPDQTTTTDGAGLFRFPGVSKLKPYLIVVWDHATVNGVTRQRVWITKDRMSFSLGSSSARDTLFHRVLFLTDSDMMADH